MATALAPHESRLQLAPFAPRHADYVARWVNCESELHWLAPSCQMPITPDSVIGWKKAGGQPLVYLDALTSRPVAYGELNPMRNEPEHWWLGHIIVDPNQRGRGLGRQFVRMLVEHANARLRAARLSLIVFPDNDPAIRCYRAVGFAKVCEEFHQFRGLGPKQRLLRFELAQ